MFQCDAFQLDAFQNDCGDGGSFQCDAFQLDAFQNDCGGGGPTLLPSIPAWRPGIGMPAGRVFTYDGRVTVYVGGAGETAFQLPPGQVHSFQGRARVRLGGDGASYCFIDPAAEIRRLDDELILMV